MSQYSFITDKKSEQYCRDIMAALVRFSGISPSEALRLINKGWRGQAFVGEKDLRCLFFIPFCCGLVGKNHDA